MQRSNRKQNEAGISIDPRWLDAAITRAFHREPTAPATGRRSRNSSQASRFSDPLLASLGLPCAVSGSASRKSAAEHSIVAPQVAIRATGGAIPQPVAAIAIADARNPRRKGDFSQRFFVFPTVLTRFSTLKSAFPHRKKRKTTLKRATTGGKTREHSGKNEIHSGKRLFPDGKSPSHSGKSRSPLWKNGFHTDEARFPPGFRRFHTWARVFHIVKTPKPPGFSGPQTGHNTAQVCPSKHPDGFREAVF